MDIRSNPERISNLTRFEDNYDWSGLEFPLSIKEISEFEKKNNIIIIVLGEEEKEIYILRGKKYDYQKKVANLLPIADGERRHYTAIKSSSRLLASRNSKHKRKQHFCMNCLQGCPTEISRHKHFEYCKDNKTVRIKMPNESSFVKFQGEQNQFKVPFIMYADFEAILKPIEAKPGQGPSPKPNPESSYAESTGKAYTKGINQHIPSGICVNSKFAYGEVEKTL